MRSHHDGKDRMKHDSRGATMNRIAKRGSKAGRARMRPIVSLHFKGGSHDWALASHLHLSGIDLAPRRHRGRPVADACRTTGQVVDVRPESVDAQGSAVRRLSWSRG